MIHYLNGEYVEDAQAVVPLNDHSFLYGDGCFEGVGVVDGRIVHLDEHVERLLFSTRALRIELGLTHDEVRDIVVETASRNGMADRPMGYLRPIVSRGRGPMGIKWSSRLEGPLFAVIAQVGDRRIALTGDPAVLTACQTTRMRKPSVITDARIKTNNYIPNVLAYLEAEERGFDVGLLTDEVGQLAEGHAMNVFSVHGDTVRTPPRVDVLDGVTRQHVLKVATELGYRVEEGPMTVYDLLVADEAFVTSSLEGVAALSKVEHYTYPGAVPGPVTTAIRTRYIEVALTQATPVTAKAV